MTELKTLKDIDGMQNTYEYSQELRQEAIKWVKEVKPVVERFKELDKLSWEGKCYFSNGCALDGKTQIGMYLDVKNLYDMWIKFFNITEEELKDE